MFLRQNLVANLAIFVILGLALPWAAEAKSSAEYKAYFQALPAVRNTHLTDGYSIDLNCQKIEAGPQGVSEDTYPAVLRVENDQIVYSSEALLSATGEFRFEQKANGLLDNDFMVRFAQMAPGAYQALSYSISTLDAEMKFDEQTQKVYVNFRTISATDGQDHGVMHACEEMGTL